MIGVRGFFICKLRRADAAWSPLRAIRAIVDEALEVLSADFEQMYSLIGRPSIAPEKLLRALLLQAFFSIRSERQLMEHLDYNLMFRWFVGLWMDALIWDVTVFTKNRDRLMAGDIAAKFMAAVLNPPRVRPLLSNDHFSVDGTLVDAWASMKSFKPKDGGSDEDDAGGGVNALEGAFDYHRTVQPLPRIGPFQERLVSGAKVECSGITALGPDLPYETAVTVRADPPLLATRGR